MKLRTIESERSPKILIIGKGKKAYLWIGDDSKGYSMCFGTKSGKKTLENFALKLLSTLAKRG